MNHPQDEGGRSGPLWAASGVVAVAATIIAALPVRTLLGVVPDDTFYYLQIARNLAATGTSTFDGWDLANGYHPLWMLLLTGLAKIVGGKIALLRIALLLSFACHISAAWVWRGNLALLLDARAASIGATIWVVSLLPLMQATFGVESALATLCAAVVVRVWLAVVRPCCESPAQRLSTRGAAVFGLALGAMVCARTDNIVWLGTALPWLLLATPRDARLRDRIGAAVRLVVTTTAAAGVVVAPWLLYSAATFGTMAQASGTMKMLWHVVWLTRLSPLGRVGLTVEQVGDWWSMLLPWVWIGGPPPRVAGLIAVVGIGAAVALAARWWPRAGAELRGTFAGMGYPISALALSTIVYAGLFGRSVQLWYYGVGYGVVFHTLYVAAVKAVRCAPSRLPARVLAALAVVAVGVGLARYGLFIRDGCYPYQRDVYDSLPTFDARVPPGAVLGCFNAGIPAYFGTRKVVNLDGLVNNAAVPYWQQYRFDDYLRDTAIVYIADEGVSYGWALLFCRTKPETETLARWPMTGWGGDRYLWRVRPR